MYQMNCNKKPSELIHGDQLECNDCDKALGSFCASLDTNRKERNNVYTKQTNMTVLQCLVCKEVIILHCNEKTVDHQCQR
jgi:hypothetical protein